MKKNEAAKQKAALGPLEIRFAAAHFTATDIFDAMNWINWIETLGTQRNLDMCLNLDT